MIFSPGIRLGPAWFVLILIVLPSCAGDGGNGRELDFEWTLDPEQPTVGPATLTVSLADSVGEPLTDAEVGLRANMSHAGMKPVLAEAVKEDSGRYRVAFEFTMAGDWYLRVEVKPSNRGASARVIEVPGVRSEQTEP